MSNNYILKCSPSDPPVVLDPDSFCPMKRLDMRLNLILEAQHDGHPWTAEYVAEATDELIRKIMSELHQEVFKFVKETNPFSIHGL